MQISKITVEYGEGQIIKLYSDEFNVIENDNWYKIEVPKELLNPVDSSLQNKIKEEYKDIPDDQFVPIPDYPSYEINKNGQVRNKRTKKITTDSQNPYKNLPKNEIPYGVYHNLNIRDGNNNQTFKGVHVLVATTFLHNPLNYPHIDHLDHDPSNNKLSNLEWKLVKDNMFNRRYKNDLAVLPENCTKITTINGNTFDELYYKDKHFYYKYSDSVIRPYNFKPKSKKYNINKVEFTTDEFLIDNPQFKSDFENQTLIQ